MVDKVDDNHNEVLRGAAELDSAGKKYNLKVKQSGPIDLSPLDRALLKESIVNKSELSNQLEAFKRDMLEAVFSGKPIIDGGGSARKSLVNAQGALKVNNQAVPDSDDPTLLVPLSGFLTDSNGNSDARVNGSLAAPIDFTLDADEDSDIYLNAISIKIADQNAQLNQFGNIAALTNGFQIIYKNQELGERVLVDNLRSNFDIIRICQGLPAFSQGVESFRASNVVANAEGYLPVLRFTENFGLPFGLRLKAGTKNKLILRIRDNVTALDAFDIFYYAAEKIGS